MKKIISQKWEFCKIICNIALNKQKRQADIERNNFQMFTVIMIDYFHENKLFYCLKAQDNEK